MPPYDDSRLATMLRTYCDHPMEDGDAVLLLDDTVCVELGGLADHWDGQLRRSTVSVVQQTASSRVLLAIARDGTHLLDGDHQIWRDVHADLRHTALQVLPLRALPAA